MDRRTYKSKRGNYINMIKELVKEYKNTILSVEETSYWLHWEFLWNDVLREIEEYNNKIVQQLEDEFVSEIIKEDKYFVQDAMVNYLLSEIDKNDLHIKDYKDNWINNEDVKNNTILCNIMQEFVMEKILQLENKSKYLQRQIDSITGKTIQTGGINDNDIANANAVPIESLLQVEGKRGYGNRVFIHSPLRQERTPSFCIYKNTNSWYDYGGAEGGDAIRLVQRLYNYDFIQAVKFLTNK